MTTRPIVLLGILAFAAVSTSASPLYPLTCSLSNWCPSGLECNAYWNGVCYCPESFEPPCFNEANINAPECCSNDQTCVSGHCVSPSDDGVVSSSANDVASEKDGLDARQLVHRVVSGSLGSVMTKVDGEDLEGFPFSSVADFIDDNGKPILLLSTMERNIINMQANNQVSLAIQERKDQDPMTYERMTLMGSLNVIKRTDDEYQAVRDRYLETHSAAEVWVDFTDFDFYRLEPRSVFWVGGFGGVHYIGFVELSDYLKHKL